MMEFRQREMRTLSETVNEARKWLGYASGTLERDALYYLEKFSAVLNKNKKKGNENENKSQ